MSRSAGVRRIVTRIQLHGRFVVEVAGRSAEQHLPGRRGRLLVAYLAANRLSAMDRGSVIELLWQPAAGRDAAAAFTVLLSKTRAVLAPIVIRGRGSLQIVMPPGDVIDAAVAASALHSAEAAVGQGAWREAWAHALSALFVTQRQFLSDLEHPWIDEHRRIVRQDHERALACYAEACLQLGGPELPSAERSARRLIESDPLAETGYRLLMRAMAQRGDRAAAIGVYERLRRALRADLGVAPGPATQAVLTELLQRQAGPARCNVPSTFRHAGRGPFRTRKTAGTGSEGIEGDMDNQVSCECGFSVRDPDEQRVVEQTLQHVRSDHPDLVATVTSDVVRGWIELVP